MQSIRSRKNNILRHAHEDEAFWKKHQSNFAISRLSRVAYCQMQKISYGRFTYLVNCNAHARRKFEPVANGAKGKGLAKEAMRFFKELYKIEREAKNNQLTPEQRYELRQKKSKPLMDKFKSWLDQLYPTVLPKSPLGNAMNYCIKLWPGLTRFLEDGRLEIDNNLTEQEIKPFVIAKILCFPTPLRAQKPFACTLALFEQQSCMASTLTTTMLSY